MQSDSCIYICNHVVANNITMETRRDIFQAIADPTRRAILALIAIQAMTPQCIGGAFSHKQAGGIKAYKNLAECELVKQELSGREIYYQLEIKKMKEIDKWLEQFRKLWENRFNELDNILSTMKNTKKMNNLLFDFTVDKATKTVTIHREFDAELSLVWDAFTKAEILDQWVAPKPWSSKTKYPGF